MIKVKKICFKLTYIQTRFSKLKNILAQSRFSTYNAKVFNLGINLRYKYTVTNIGIKLWNKFIYKRDLIKVDILD